MSIQRNTESKSVTGLKQTNTDIQLSYIFTKLAEAQTKDPMVQVRVARGTSLISHINEDGSKEYVKGLHRPLENLIELDGSIISNNVDLAKLRFRQNFTLQSIAPLFGVYMHEIGHKLYTLFDRKDMVARFDALETKEEKHHFNNVVAALFLLEETRMESHVNNVYYQYKPFLNAAFKELIYVGITNAEAENKKLDAASVCAIVLARVDARTVNKADIQELWSLTEDHLGIEVLEQAQAIWRKFHKVDHDDFDKAYAIAEEWLKVFPSKSDKCNCDNSEEEEEGESQGDNAEGEGDNAEGEGDNAEGEGDNAEGEGDNAEGEGECDKCGGKQGSSSEEYDPKEEDYSKAAKAALTRVSKEIIEKADSEIKHSRTPKHVVSNKSVEDGKKNDEEYQKSKKVANTIFHGDSGFQGKAIQVHWSDPNDKQKKDALIIEQFIRKLVWIPPAQHKVNTTTPGGKLRVNEAMRLDAQRTMKVQQTAKPWNNNQLVRNPPVKLKVGMGLDQSASMRAIINELTGGAYSISKAMQNFNAEFAGVTFGDRVAPLVEKGTQMSQVPSLNADAPHEAIGTAIQALDGNLGLSVKDNSIKLLMLFTDGYWVNNAEAKKGINQLERLRNNNVKTFIFYTHETDRKSHHGCEFIKIDNDNWVNEFLRILEKSI